MAELQRSTNAGETAQLFVQFIQMQQQQALLALGKHPKLPRDAAPVNLTLGKVFIDQLGVIREKTRSNLSGEEQAVLDNALALLKNAYLEAVSEGSES